MHNNADMSLSRKIVENKIKVSYMHNLNPVLKSVEIVENKSYLNKNSKLYFCQTSL